MTPIKKSRLTQADVAKFCGVSRSTVAAVMRNRHEANMLHPKTRQKVLNAIKELGYRPNMAGVALRGGKKNTVALAIPNMQAIEGAIACKILQGIGDEASRLGYNLILSIYDETPGRLRTSLSHILKESRIDGVFVYGMETGSDPRESVLEQFNCPYVVLDRHDTSANSFTFDNVGGSRMAVEHLIKNGRRKIAIIGYRKEGLFGDRYKGYRQALENAGLPFDSKLCVYQQPGFFNIGPHAILKLLADGCKFDALFCTSEPVAMKSLQDLAKAGLEVPKDVAIVAYDDTMLSEMAVPPLTSVREDGELLGHLAMQKLDALLRGESIRPEAQVIPVSLTVRESCGCGKCD
ncbi:MAG: LacI family transcriptional regulator [Planctomycetes bacterium]|jgi:DNA-binding LacI/PurR family transcriptional regulator|nr:LacI family transcriptional regulator [Planctomycetota bacterium]